MSATERLDKIEARATAASDGPWYQGRNDQPHESARDVYSQREPDDHDSHDIATYVWTEEDAAFITHARTDVPALVAALRAVLALVTDDREDRGAVTRGYTPAVAKSSVRDAITEALR